jgi:2-keto-3-deoxy-L-rhamnonate aldolase RhmA
VLIDAEHGPLMPTDAELLVRAAEAAGISALVRCPNVGHEILRYLDVGAVGVQVPHIESGEAAREAAASLRYPPLGDRGLAHVTRAAGYGVDVPVAEYVAEANRQMLYFPVIESVAGVTNVDAIATTPGVDAIALGPGDLSSSMGHSGNRTHPDVKAAVAHVIERAKAHRKWVATAAYDPLTAQAAFAAGAEIVEVPPPALFATAGRDFVRQARQRS